MTSKRLNDDLVTCLVVYPQENLRIMFKLWTAEIRGDRNTYIEAAVARLKSEGKGPGDLIRSAKKWVQIPLTPAEEEIFREK